MTPSAPTRLSAGPAAMAARAAAVDMAARLVDSEAPAASGARDRRRHLSGQRQRHLDENHAAEITPPSVVSAVKADSAARLRSGPGASGHSSAARERRQAGPALAAQAAREATAAPEAPRALAPEAEFTWRKGASPYSMPPSRGTRRSAVKEALAAAAAPAVLPPRALR